jgi:hypothetical protein
MAWLTANVKMIKEYLNARTDIDQFIQEKYPDPEPENHDQSLENSGI